MYVLVVRDPQGNETEYDLVGEVVLGRDASAGVQLSSSEVSRQHARLFIEDGLCYVEDLGSANGTLVGGAPVPGAVVLDPGAEVKLGPFVVWIEEPARGAAPTTAPGALTADTFAGPMPGPGDGATFTGAAPGAAALATLEGLGGVAIGQNWELGRQATVGRVAGNHVVLDDASVSRQHAEIFQQGGAFLVRDLGSSNGTFVNGEPVAEQLLQDGDVLRFGEVETRFAEAMGAVLAPPMLGEGIGAGTAPGLPSSFAVPRGRAGARRRGRGGGGSRKKLLIAAGLGVAVLLVAAIALKGGQKPGPAGGAGKGGAADARPGTDDLKERVFSLSRRGKALMESEQWSEAASIFEQIIELDPINREARELMEKTALEKRMQFVYQDAERKSELGEEEAALALFTAIDSASSYNRRASFKVRGTIELLMKRYDAECKGNFRANRFKDAQRTCGRYMDFACQCPGPVEPEAAKILAKAESRQRPDKPWRCPTDLGRWMPCDTGPKESCSESTVGRAYADKTLAKAVMLYCKGDLDDSMKTLDKVRHDFTKGTSRDIAQELFSNMKIVQGKYNEGLALILKNDPVSAHDPWRTALTADEKIITSTEIKSEYRRQMMDRLINGYAAKGNEQAAQERYRDAFQWFTKASEVDPSDRRVREGFMRLDRAAAYLAQRAAGCEDLRKILAMTQEVSVTHKQAAEAGKRRNCRF